MAGARAAASLSLTIGVACVTVLIVGGILAGPTILDCSHQPSSFGACLRDRLDHSRLVPVPVRDEPSQTPVLSSELPAPPVPAPPSRVADGTHGDGWLDARANEYEPPATSALEPPSLPPLPDLVTPITPPVPAPSEVAELTSAPLPPAPPAPPALPPLLNLGPTGGELGTANATTAEIEIVPMPVPRQRPAPTLKPKAEVKKPVAKPARVAKLVPKALPRPKPPHIFKNDPRFPNVTVLGPPSSGSNSSFVTLAAH